MKLGTFESIILGSYLQIKGCLVARFVLFFYYRRVDGRNTGRYIRGTVAAAFIHSRTVNTGNLGCQRMDGSVCYQHGVHGSRERNRDTIRIGCRINGTGVNQAIYIVRQLQSNRVFVVQRGVVHLYAHCKIRHTTGRSLSDGNDRFLNYYRRLKNVEHKPLTMFDSLCDN